jgi:hypothetical protein
VAPGPTRRAVLAASAAAVPLLATGCRGIQVLSSPPGPAPDIRLLRVLITAEQMMVARYLTAIAQAGSATASPGSTATPGPSSTPSPGSTTAPSQGGQSVVVSGLMTILAEHQQHLARLRARLIEPASYRSPAAGSHAAALPAGLDDLLAALASDEQAAGSRLNAAALTMPPAAAQLLASIAASEATHVPALDALRRPR